MEILSKENDPQLSKKYACCLRTFQLTELTMKLVKRAVQLAFQVDPRHFDALWQMAQSKFIQVIDRDSQLLLEA